MLCYTHIPRMAVFRMVDALGANCKSPLKASRELRSRWSGYFLVDTDALAIAGKEWHLLLGADAGTQDIVHAVLTQQEDEASFRNLFRALQEPLLGYPLRGLTSDMDLALRKTLATDWPALPHQYCTIHFLRWMPQDTNIAEGIIRQLDRKLTDLNGFQSPKTAWHSLKMQIMRYRFKRFTDSRHSSHNWKSPLELAAVDIQGIDWVRYSQRAW